MTLDVNVNITLDQSVKDFLQAMFNGLSAPKAITVDTAAPVKQIAEDIKKAKATTSAQLPVAPTTPAVETVQPVTPAPEQPAKEITMEQVREKAAEKMQAGKKPGVLKLLTEFAVPKDGKHQVPGIPKDKYPEFLEKLSAL